MHNRPCLHCDASLKQLISTPIAATMAKTTGETNDIDDASILFTCLSMELQGESEAACPEIEGTRIQQLLFRYPFHSCAFPSVKIFHEKGLLGVVSVEQRRENTDLIFVCD